MAEVFRAKGASKDAQASLEPVAVPIAKRPMVAGEIPGYSKKFDRLWAMFPGRYRDTGDKARAKNYLAELSLQEFVMIVEVWGDWCAYWSSFPQAEMKYIPRIQNWAARNGYRYPAPTPRKDGELYKRNAEKQGPSVPIVTRTRAEILSDCQTGKDRNGNPRIVGKPTEIALEDMAELTELANALKKLAG